ncbi:response regulator [Sphingomonas glaciei]|uniref:Response regulator n=1 Tax=Sphingomonas glaciei TaxID=2938948 RepID=A0ABY5MUY3_9SPHN|nr:response regulator [Sphingomonas glaciei]UUR07545.1 response regulator [Sphingomonas glaciei]
MTPTSLRPASRPRLLVVSPNRSHLALLARRLGAEGYSIVTAADGGAALGELHRSPIDLVLAELVMEPMSGPELTRAIREHSGFAEVPVMLIASRAEADPAVRAFAAGAEDVILKPFHFEVLVARIERRRAAAAQVAAMRADMEAMDARAAMKAIELGELKDRMYALEAERRRVSA